MPLLVATWALTILLLCVSYYIITYPVRVWLPERHVRRLPGWGLLIVWVVYFGFLWLFLPDELEEVGTDARAGVEWLAGVMVFWAVALTWRWVRLRRRDG